MKGDQVFRESGHLSALHMLAVRLEFFANSVRRLEEPGSTVPGDLKPTFDTLVYASTKLKEVDELPVIAEQLFQRYGRDSFYHALKLENGHNVDAVVMKGIEAWYIDPPLILIAEELDKIATSAVPPIPFDKVESLKGTFGREEVSPRELVGALHPAPSVSSDVLPKPS